MWRCFFLAIGISLGLLGGECFVVDRAVINLPSSRTGGALSALESSRSKEIAPPEWAPWSLLSAGAVVTLYAMTLHRA